MHPGKHVWERVNWFTKWGRQRQGATGETRNQHVCKCEREELPSGRVRKCICARVHVRTHLESRGLSLRGWHGKVGEIKQRVSAAKKKRGNVYSLLLQRWKEAREADDVACLQTCFLFVCLFLSAWTNSVLNCRSTQSEDTLVASEGWENTDWRRCCCIKCRVKFRITEFISVWLHSQLIKSNLWREYCTYETSYYL